MTSIGAVVLIIALVFLAKYVIDKRFKEYKSEAINEYTDEELASLKEEMEIISKRMKKEKG